MDPATLSAGLVTLLSPLLPYLTGFGQGAADAAAERVGRSIGEAAVQRSAALWDRLWPGLRGRPPARQAVTAIAENPRAEQPRVALVREIAALLRDDPELARETAALLQEISGQGVVNDVREVTVGGKQNVVQIGNENVNTVR